MDFGQIIYIVAIVAYFLYRASSKKKNTPLPDAEEAAPETPKKGFTFEELLREIREAQTPSIPELEPEPMPLPKPKPAYTIPQQDRPMFQPTSSKEEVIFEGLDYEQSKTNSQAMSFYTDTEALRAPLDQGKSILYELDVERTNPYAELLKNPTSFRDAVVLSEILKPKYFWVLINIFTPKRFFDWELPFLILNRNEK